MKLTIDNFAKISHADISIDGITVIAGENNTGKSTVGKILFSLFNATSNFNDKILNQRMKEIQTTCWMNIHSYFLSNGKSASKIYRSLSEITYKITENIRKTLASHKEDNYEYICRILKDSLPNDDLVNTDELITLLAEKINDLLKLSENSVMLEILTRYFEGMFNHQINSLIKEDTVAKLTLTVKNNTIDLSFVNDECTEFIPDISLVSKAIYIDNPFIIDKLSSFGDLSITENYLNKLLLKVSEADIMEGVFETVLAKEKLNEIFETLRSIVNGQIIFNNDEFYLKKEGFSKPISFTNLSTGLKSFVIIKMLVENNLIKEKDVLILDEPEIHLHPQWQVVYAELIVLLQKVFDLSIIVTTHSPYFLDAINLFSVKYGIDSKVNYYLSSVENDAVQMTSVTNNLDLIYQKMVSPIEMLETLRYELNNN